MSPLTMAGPPAFPEGHSRPSGPGGGSRGQLREALAAGWNERLLGQPWGSLCPGLGSIPRSQSKSEPLGGEGGLTGTEPEGAGGFRTLPHMPSTGWGRPHTALTVLLGGWDLCSEESPGTERMKWRPWLGLGFSRSGPDSNLSLWGPERSKAAQL